MYQGATRPEVPEDVAAIHSLHQQAFGRPDEAVLVAALRASKEFDPRLSLVAVSAGQIIGHILFSRVEIDTVRRRLPALALAPMAVVPKYQRRGVGSTLVLAGLEAARTGGHKLIVVVGHPEYYPRFGFQSASPHGLRLPFAVPDEAFMVVELSAGALDLAAGMIVYPPEFAAVC